ncbi:MAG: transposase [Calothrix sp. FI2-JRJ7]|nr:transposase [Calothrix sp. FI2-JRJ7]
MFLFRKNKPEYRRLKHQGGTYFFTLVTYDRYPWLCNEDARFALRTSMNRVRQKYPFKIDVFVLLPEHFHCILTLPEGDSDFATRWRLIKYLVTKRYADKLALQYPISESRQKRGERNLWQRRFWEHLIRDDRDYENHCNYIHYNPVKHGLCNSPQDWKYSSYHRLVKQNIYSKDWGTSEVPNIKNLIIDKEFE